MKITNPIFLQQAGRGGKNAKNTIRFITTISDPSVYKISCDGDIIVNSVKNGEVVTQTYSNLSETQLSIQADANTEVIIIGNVTIFDCGIYQGWGYADSLLASSIIFDCKTLNKISGLSGLNAQDASSVLLSISVVGCGKSLQYLTCSYTGITELDLSKNIALETLDCSNCPNLTALDLSKNTALTSLDCYDCPKLITLDLSNNTALKTLDCYDCPNLTALDLSKNTTLRSLYCSNCLNFTTLDLSNNTALKTLYCDGCPGLTELDFSTNTALVSLDCSNCVAVNFIKYGAGNSSVSTKIANLITANKALDGTVYTDSEGEYYSTIADAATAAGWTIAQL